MLKACICQDITWELWNWGKRWWSCRCFRMFGFWLDKRSWKLKRNRNTLTCIYKCFRLYLLLDMSSSIRELIFLNRDKFELKATQHFALFYAVYHYPSPFLIHLLLKIFFKILLLFVNLPLFSRSSSYVLSGLFCPWPPSLSFLSTLPSIRWRQFFVPNNLATSSCNFLFLPIAQISGVTSFSKTSFQRPFSYSVWNVLTTCLANCNILTHIHTHTHTHTHTHMLPFPVQCTVGTKFLFRG